MLWRSHDAPPSYRPHPTSIAMCLNKGQDDRLPTAGNPSCFWWPCTKVFGCWAASSNAIFALRITGEMTVGSCLLKCASIAPGLVQSRAGARGPTEVPSLVLPAKRSSRCCLPGPADMSNSNSTAPVYALRTYSGCWMEYSWLARIVSFEVFISWANISRYLH